MVVTTGLEPKAEIAVVPLAIYSLFCYSLFHNLYTTEREKERESFMLCPGLLPLVPNLIALY